MEIKNTTTNPSGYAPAAVVFPDVSPTHSSKGAPKGDEAKKDETPAQSTRSRGQKS